MDEIQPKIVTFEYEDHYKVRLLQLVESVYTYLLMDKCKMDCDWWTLNRFTEPNYTLLSTNIHLEAFNWQPSPALFYCIIFSTARW